MMKFGNGAPNNDLFVSSILHPLFMAGSTIQHSYRTSNEGKFPSATYVRKQVGGSCYVAWSLLQELEYDSRLGSGVRDASFNSENFKGRCGLNNIDLSTRDVRTS